MVPLSRWTAGLALVFLAACDDESAVTSTRSPLLTESGWSIAGGVAGLGDWNGDGSVDLLRQTVFFGSPPHWDVEFALFLSTSGSLASSPAWVSVLPDHIANTYRDWIEVVPDVTGDGFPDIVILTPIHARVFAAGPAGVATTPAWEVELPDAGSAAAATDANGDGRRDLIIAYGEQDPWEVTPQSGVRMYAGTVAGLSTVPSWEGFAASSQILSLQTPDFDSNGSDDLVAVGYSAVESFPSNGLPGFQGPPAVLATDGSFGWSASGDFDGNGFADLAFCDWNTHTTGWSRVHLHYGSQSGLVRGPPITSESLQTYDGFCADIAAGDLDGDGLDDLVVLASALDGGTTLVFSGDPNGIARTKSAKLLGPASVVLIGDVSSDGRPDLLVGTPQLSRLVVSTGAMPQPLRIRSFANMTLGAVEEATVEIEIELALPSESPTYFVFAWGDTYPPSLDLVPAAAVDFTPPNRYRTSHIYRWSRDYWPAGWVCGSEYESLLASGEAFDSELALGRCAGVHSLDDLSQIVVENSPPAIASVTVERMSGAHHRVTVVHTDPGYERAIVDFDWQNDGPSPDDVRVLPWEAPWPSVPAPPGTGPYAWVTTGWHMYVAGTHTLGVVVSDEAESAQITQTIVVAAEPGPTTSPTAGPTTSPTPGLTPTPGSTPHEADLPNVDGSGPVGGGCSITPTAFRVPIELVALFLLSVLRPLRRRTA